MDPMEEPLALLAAPHGATPEPLTQAYQDQAQERADGSARRRPS